MKAKLIKILILVLMIILLFNNSEVFATEDPFTNPEYYEPDIDNIEYYSYEFEKKIETILGVVNAIGVACSVSILGIIGVRYMVGSVEAKAEYKKTMMGYIVGAIILFSGTTIPNIIYQVSISTWTETVNNDRTPPGRKPLPPIPLNPDDEKFLPY